MIAKAIGHPYEEIPAMDQEHKTPGALLAHFMRRRGWSAPRLAEIAGGVSASSIRAYLTDRTAPRPGQALAVAGALGPLDGRALLVAWGHTDLAEGFYEHWRGAGTDDHLQRMTQAYYRHNQVEYPGEPLSEHGLEVVRATIGWIQQIEQAAQVPAEPVAPRHRRIHPPQPPAEG